LWQEGARKNKEFTSEFEMKDLGMMHYFLGLEVWQRIDEIFLNQGKYAVEILKRFGMLYCKVMATPMVSNLKLLQDITSDIVDYTLIWEDSGLIDVFDEHKNIYLFFCEHPESIFGAVQTGSLGYRNVD
jgi:hypothetical protein